MCDVIGVIVAVGFVVGIHYLFAWLDKRDEKRFFADLDERFPGLDLRERDERYQRWLFYNSLG